MANPYWRYGALSLGAALALALLFSLALDSLMAWLMAVNLTTLMMFRYDKAIAGSRRMRVPERVLLLLVMLGGTFGAIMAMWFIPPRHKTQSAGFLTWLLLIAFLQAAAWFAYFYFRLAWGGLSTI